MKWRLIEEARKTPSDMESINASFNKDVSDEKFEDGFLPSDTLEINEPGFKQYIRNGVRYYEVS